MALTRIKYRTGSTELAYLRVSTKGQVETEFDPAGMSLPTQSRLCAEKARQKSLTILDELIDPGVSGTSIEKRKSYQELLKRLEADPTISFVMVYSLFRLHRNWPEAGRMV